jgi:hypothetical protein
LGALKWGGLEFMLDNVAGPDVFGFRLHARPAVFVTDRPWAHRLVVGFSFADDVHAPADLETVTPPPPAPPAPPAPPQPRSDDGHLWAKSTANVGVFGIDAEYQALTTRIVDVVPYLDVNFQRAAGNTGAGMHLGVFVNLRVPTPVGPSLSMRLEYRVVGSGYLPRYFDSAYQAQRWQYDASNVICAQGEQGCTPGVPLTKLQVLRRGGAGPNGWMGELYADLAGWLAVGGTFEDYQGPNNASLTLSLLFPRLRFIQCGAYYTRRGFDGVSGVFDLDGALLTAWIQARVYGPLYLNASYTRSWHLQPDGTYDSDNNWGVGAGVAFGY